VKEMVLNPSDVAHSDSEEDDEDVVFKDKFFEALNFYVP